MDAVITCRFYVNRSNIIVSEVSVVFGNNSDFIPRTYSIKSMKKRKYSKIKKLVTLLVSLIIAAMMSGLIFLSYYIVA